MMSTFEGNFFANDATPGGIVELSRQMSDEEFVEILERWSK
jgi:hypothetical protein